MTALWCGSRREWGRAGARLSGARRRPGMAWPCHQGRQDTSRPACSATAPGFSGWLDCVSPRTPPPVPGSNVPAPLLPSPPSSTRVRPPPSPTPPPSPRLPPLEPPRPSLPLSPSPSQLLAPPPPPTIVRSTPSPAPAPPPSESSVNLTAIVLPVVLGEPAGGGEAGAATLAPQAAAGPAQRQRPAPSRSSVGSRQPAAPCSNTSPPWEARHAAQAPANPKAFFCLPLPACRVQTKQRAALRQAWKLLLRPRAGLRT